MVQQSTEEFVAKAKKIWGDEYDYSRVVYRGPRRPVTIICRVHGAFEQLPYNHLNGHRCGRCSRAGRRMTTAEFVARAKVVFGEYDFSRTVYRLTNVPVVVECPTHGLFRRRPTDILRGRGCPRCERAVRHRRGPDFKLPGWVVELIREVLRERKEGVRRG